MGDASKRGKERPKRVPRQIVSRGPIQAHRAHSGEVRVLETPRLFDEQSIRDELAQAVAEAVDDSCAGGGAGLEADELERVTQHVTGLLLAHPVIRRIQAEAWFEGARAQWLYGPKSIPNEYKKNPYREEQ